MEFSVAIVVDAVDAVDAVTAAIVVALFCFDKQIIVYHKRAEFQRLVLMVK